jgi:2-hydroxychromene-2-carboxylate isomerase
MPVADWYFDFISPYSYFGLLQLDTLSPRVQLRYRPVLFAGLLNHWGQKGPAEIPSKRIWTYRWCIWWAQRQGIPFRMPAMHPFNPVSYLRLALVTGCDPAAIRLIFEALWTTGADPGDPQVLAELMRKLKVDPAKIDEQSIKSALRGNSDQAAANGVFGVPTLVVNGQLFWGADAMGFVHDYLDDPQGFNEAEMQRTSTLPIGIARKSS